MSTVHIATPVHVTLKAADWYWLLGVLDHNASGGESQVIDNLYGQIMSQTE
jgi:hypothetical protein